MFTRICLSASLCCLLFVVCPLAGVLARDIPGQAVVQLDPRVSRALAFRGADVTVLDSIPNLQMYLVSFPTDVPFEKTRAALTRRQGFRAVHPNRSVELIHPLQATVGYPDDDAPVFVSGEQPASYYGQPTVLSIGLDSARTLTLGDGVTIAVIDNGVDCTHPLFDSLSAPLLNDLIDSDNDPSEMPGVFFGHGTFTAGLIRLAAPGADLMIIRAFDTAGYSTVFTITQAIDWAVVHGADLINMSFGTTTANTLLEIACDRALDSGVTLIASVGNSGSTQPVYPAAYPSVIGVGAIDSLDLIAPFSNGHSVDICAPGVSLYSALPNPWLWGTWSGTSFAAALVSACAGLVLSLSPGIIPADMEALLHSTATTALDWGTITPPDPYYGSGRVDAYAAVLACQPMPVAKSSFFTVADLRIISVAVTTGRIPEQLSLLRLDLNHDGALGRTDLDLAIFLLFGRSAPRDYSRIPTRQ